MTSDFKLPVVGMPSAVTATPPPAGSLAERLAVRTTRGVLHSDAAEDGRIRCLACAHRCALADGETGICGVRRRSGAELLVPWGYVARRNVRPVETNTIYHVHPGALSMTFGMYGCDLRCGYCHNWQVSQALREGVENESPHDISPDALIEEAVVAGCEVVCAAYNEPMITAEWTRAIFEAAKRRGLTTALVTDGNTTAAALAYMRPVTDVFRVDLKSGNGAAYRLMGGRLQPVLDGIVEARRLGYWIEVVTLIVPGFNDDRRELRSIAETLRAIDADIPWHVNAFQPKYKMQDRPRTTPEALVSAAGSGYARGLNYVYAGNVPDRLSALSHTRCPSCTAVLIERSDHQVNALRLRDGGACFRCGSQLPGLWGDVEKRQLAIRGRDPRTPTPTVSLTPGV